MKQPYRDKWKVIKNGDVPHSSTFHNSTQRVSLSIFISTKTAQTSHGFDGRQRKSQKRKRSRKGAPLGTAGPRGWENDATRGDMANCNNKLISMRICTPMCLYVYIYILIYCISKSLWETPVLYEIPYQSYERFKTIRWSPPSRWDRYHWHLQRICWSPWPPTARSSFPKLGVRICQLKSLEKTTALFGLWSKQTNPFPSALQAKKRHISIPCWTHFFWNLWIEQ